MSRSLPLHQLGSPPGNRPSSGHSAATTDQQTLTRLLYQTSSAEELEDLETTCSFLVCLFHQHYEREQERKIQPSDSSIQTMRFVY